jgi:hypothetical protein
MPVVPEGLPAMHPMTTSDLPLQRIGRGKVRDVYAVDRATSRYRIRMHM